MGKTSINNEKFIDRLEMFMLEKGLNNNMLTEKANLSNGLIGKARKSRSEMNSESIERILLSFPDLNADWLLTGRGEMTLKSGIPLQFNESLTINLTNKIDKLEDEVKKLCRENGRLEGKLEMLVNDSGKAG